MNYDHNEHVELHKLHAKSMIESQEIWVNEPTGLNWLWFKITGKPKPIFKSLLEIQKDLNEHINQHIDQMRDNKK